MKKHTIIIFLLIILSSCNREFVQVFDTNSTNTQLKDNYFIYETDSVKITYNFWSNKGVMSFAVYNKLDKPIYIDWKNSSFIYNDNKLNYWVEETESSNYSKYYGKYYYNGPLLKPGVTSDGETYSNTHTIKPERITFIPPKSNYYRSQFLLLPIDYFEFSNYDSSIVSRNDKPKKQTTIYYKNYLYNNSPLRFRNYLAITLSENSQKFIFIDNEFYINSVKEIDKRHFNGKKIGNNQDYYYENPFKRATLFYILTPKYKSIEEKNKFE